MARAPRSPDLAATRLIDGLETVVQGLMRVARQEASSAGLSMPQFFILRRIQRRGSMPATLWAEQTGIRASSASGLVDGLVRNQWVVRGTDPEDRRRVLIRLSARGSALVERVDARRRRRVRSALRGLGPREIAQAQDVVEDLAERFSAEGPSNPRAARSAPPRVRRGSAAGAARRGRTEAGDG